VGRARTRRTSSSKPAARTMRPSVGSVASRSAPCRSPGLRGTALQLSAERAVDSAPGGSLGQLDAVTRPKLDGIPS
jgi:hypothetical protein